VTDETGRAGDDATPGGITDGGNARRYLLGAAVTVVAFAGIAGYTLGSNSPAESTTVLGVLTLPVTSLSLAAYGVVLAGTVVTVLFGLVTLASRIDDDAVE
jgi:hypothetical protein